MRNQSLLSAVTSCSLSCLIEEYGTNCVNWEQHSVIRCQWKRFPVIIPHAYIAWKKYLKNQKRNFANNMYSMYSTYSVNCTHRPEIVRAINQLISF